MNNSSNLPGDALDDQYSPFERRLRDRSLGSGPRQRGELLYECGYAAGVVETRNQLGRAKLRWRAIGMAASVLACASLAAHFRSFETSNSNQSGVERPGNSSQSEAGMPNQTQTTDQWLAQLTKERGIDRQHRGTLRASGAIRVITDVNEPDSEFSPIEPFNHESTLQPRDFPLFLQGEV